LAVALVGIVDHLKSELQEVEAQLAVLYEKRDGLEQVLGVAIESEPEPSIAGPQLCYINPRMQTWMEIANGLQATNVCSPAAKMPGFCAQALLSE